jgi:hypothetical protein
MGLLQEAGWDVMVIRECSVKEDTARLIDHLRSRKLAA